VLKSGNILLIGAFATVLVGCAQPGANLQSNVYQAGQVNQQQEARVIDILAVLPAKVEVSNAQNRASAQIVGGVLGVLVGAALGSKFGGMGLGGLAGGGAGVAAGSLVPDSALVEGVSLTYTDSGRTLNSAQVGRLCDYKPGKAIVISTGPGETRIQPNDTCPTKTATK
jgi:outer membrane lipoprotein SlyB